MTLPSISRRAVKWTAAAMLTGAVLLVVASRRDESPLRQPGPDLVPRLSELDSHIRSLQGMGARSTLEQQWRAARWIAERFEETGLDTTIEPYEEAGQSWPNVVARIAGARPDGDVVMVTAHLDSIAATRRQLREPTTTPAGWPWPSRPHTIWRAFGSTDRLSSRCSATRSAALPGAGATRGPRGLAEPESRRSSTSTSWGTTARRRSGCSSATGAHASAKYKLKAAWRRSGTTPSAGARVRTGSRSLGVMRIVLW